MRKKRKQNQPIYIIAAVIFVILLAVFLAVAFSGKDKETAEETAVQQGISYLASLEKKDPAQVHQVRKDIYREKMETQRDEVVRQVESGEVDPYSLFKDYVVMGDSRAVGFWYHGFLEKDRVLADGGNTIRNIPKRLDELKEINPSYVFLCYGLNDTSIGYWKTGEAYAKEYVSCVDQIKEALPDATIVVSSILPAQDPAFERSSKWRNIPAWNKILKAVCEENGIIYADCDQLHKDYSNLWDPDGIHLRKNFYPHWGRKLIVTLLMGETLYEE